METNNKSLVLRLFFFLVFVESIISLYFLFIIPSDVKNSMVFGFSRFRLLLMGGVLSVVFFSISMFLNVKRVGLKVHLFLEDSRRQSIQRLVVFSALVLGIIFFCTPSQRIGEALYHRLLPLVVLIVIISLQILIVQFFWTDKKLNLDFFAENRRAMFFFCFTLTVFILVWIFIARTGIGIDRGPSGWLSPGTPVLPQQLFFCILVGLFFFIFRSRFDKYMKGGFLPAVAIWLLACIAWWSEPLVRQGYFNPTPTPPNFEYYPYSDALHYDWFSQNLLIGTSRSVGLTIRPLYSLLLALLHFIGGNGLHNILFMQVVILAIIPAVAYLLVSRLSSYPAGIIAALIITIRERNSIALTNIIEVSHVKLIMSDVPAMLTMVLFVYFFVKWFQEREDRYMLGVLAGSSLGLSIFVRSQAQLLVLVALIGIILIERFSWRSILQKAVVFLLGVAVVVIPWVCRNYQVSGRVVVEYLDFYTRFIASTYSSTPGEIELLPGETSSQYRDRMKRQVVQYIVDHPIDVAHFYTSYFLHNEIASLTYLPMSFRFDTLYRYVDKVGFWAAPYLGNVPFLYLPNLFLIVCFVAFGIGVTFQRFRWVGMMPLFFHFAYSFSSVPVRQSGWRFILPVDWIVVLYFCIGLTEFGLLVHSLFSSKFNALPIKPESKRFARRVSWSGTSVTFASFALLGIAIPLIEFGIPERYPALPNDELIYAQVPNGVTLEDRKNISAANLTKFLETDPDATVLYGRALYPSYYESGKFWGDANATLLEASKYDRLQFNLIGSRNAFVFIPLQKVPEYFPNASDVFIVGCLQRESVRALIVKINDIVLDATPLYGLTCSLTE